MGFVVRGCAWPGSCKATSHHTPITKGTSMIERNCFKLGLAAVVLGAATAASATPLVIAGLGANNWTSGDTRNNTGAQATQAQIDAQIKFLAEGVIVADAAGVLPDAPPSGSLGGLGYLRLDGTDNNLGKSA